MQADNRFDALWEISFSEDGSTDQEQGDMSEDNAGDRNDERPGSLPEADPVIDCPHFHFVREIMGAALPHDDPAQGAFDNRCDFDVGDPGTRFGGVHNCDYAMSGDKGMPHWTALFRCLLMHFEHVRWLNTVFVLVDSRDRRREAWWKSRLTMYGPAEELCDLLFVPIGQATGLHNVHPTWAGTFVLAALRSFFRVSTLCCLTVIVCPLRYLK